MNDSIFDVLHGPVLTAFHAGQDRQCAIEAMHRARAHRYIGASDAMKATVGAARRAHHSVIRGLRALRAQVK